MKTLSELKLIPSQSLTPNQQEFLKSQALELKMTASYLMERLNEIQPVEGSDNPPELESVANKLNTIATDLSLFPTQLNRIP